MPTANLQRIWPLTICAIPQRAMQLTLPMTLPIEKCLTTTTALVTQAWAGGAWPQNSIGPNGQPLCKFSRRTVRTLQAQLGWRKQLCSAAITTRVHTHTHTHTRTYQAVRRKDASNSRFQCSTCGANKHIYLHTHSHKGTQACKIAASKQYRNSLRFLPIEATLRYHTLRAMNEVTCSKISILKLINHQAQLNHTDH